MKEYQVYSIDQNGAIIWNRVIEAASDEDAVISVRSMQRPHNTEVWHRDRRIGRIPAYGG
jgi:hypothetical protein